MRESACATNTAPAAASRGASRGVAADTQPTDRMAGRLDSVTGFLSNREGAFITVYKASDVPYTPLRSTRFTSTICKLIGRSGPQDGLAACARSFILPKTPRDGRDQIRDIDQAVRPVAGDHLGVGYNPT